ncbi:hypothetical protein QFZ94_004794 [Paraburkholderia sp. JPY465]|uniref:hypothetical protein n=1 Tax=Paraburkholderia sp. JPY465 TaxID=3042285 RepID=UPI003D2317B8
MPLQKDYETPSTGATASYHVVQQVSLDFVSSRSNATVASYLSKDARDAGKFALYTQQIAVAGLPDAGVDALEFVQQQLIVGAQQDGSGPYANRFVFAGAEIVS